jgi:ABC-type Fe3+-hydroxamate transport system substrate-binding protein
VGDRIRVVVLSPAASRFALALGAGHLIVGVDTESQRIPELAELPVVALADAGRLSPDLVLVRGLPADDDPVARELRSAGAELVEFAPHDLEDVFELCRRVGGRLVGTTSALRFETDLARPLAQIGGSSFGRLRPRVLAVVGFDPLELAGGHSFETDLIEIAGGRSLTHGGDEARLAVDAEQLSTFAPDLILVVTPREASPAERRSARDALPSDYRVEFFAVDTELFWLRDPVEPARRLRDLIEPLSRELEARRQEAAR